MTSRSFTRLPCAVRRECDSYRFVFFRRNSAAPHSRGSRVVNYSSSFYYEWYAPAIASTRGEQPIKGTRRRSS
jgi:hypothetical protein